VLGRGDADRRDGGEMAGEDWVIGKVGVKRTSKRPSNQTGAPNIVSLLGLSNARGVGKMLGVDRGAGNGGVGGVDSGRIVMERGQDGGVRIAKGAGRLPVSPRGVYAWAASGYGGEGETQLDPLGAVTQTHTDAHRHTQTHTLSDSPRLDRWGGGEERRGKGRGEESTEVESSFSGTPFSPSLSHRPSLFGGGGAGGGNEDEDSLGCGEAAYLSAIRTIAQTINSKPLLVNSRPHLGKL